MYFRTPGIVLRPLNMEISHFSQLQTKSPSLHIIPGMPPPSLQAYIFILQKCTAKSVRGLAGNLTSGAHYVFQELNFSASLSQPCLYSHIHRWGEGHRLPAGRIMTIYLEHHMTAKSYYTTFFVTSYKYIRKSAKKVREDWCFSRDPLSSMLDWYCFYFFFHQNKLKNLLFSLSWTLSQYASSTQHCTREFMHGRIRQGLLL